MTKQPEALRLADALDAGHYLPATTAAELRRLHQSETEGWRYADELEQDRKHLADVNADLLEALKALNSGCRDHRCLGLLLGLDLARNAIAKATGEKNEKL